MKAGSNCCQLPLKAPEEEEVTAGLAVAEDMSMDAGGAGWYFYIIRITALTSFLSGKDVFGFLRPAFARV